jgi:hypothetical protein
MCKKLLVALQHQELPDTRSGQRENKLPETDAKGWVLRASVGSSELSIFRLATAGGAG